jgi:enoyl-CoA hydratase/carnithine racemase
MNAPDDQRMTHTCCARISDGVATLTLNRPRSSIRCRRMMLTALQAALDAIAADPAVRVVVIAGAGKAFCAGHDLKEMRANHHKAFMQELFKAVRQG